MLIHYFRRCCGNNYLSRRNEHGKLNTFSTSIFKRMFCVILSICHYILHGIFSDRLKLARVTPIPMAVIQL